MSSHDQKTARNNGVSGANSLAAYLDRIRDNPEDLRTVSRTVNPMNFDVTSILQHLENRGEFPAVEFTNPLNVRGEPSAFPVVANMWATRERCAGALGLPRSQAGIELSTYF